MSTYLEEAKMFGDEAIEFLQNELSQLRTGRASPALVENIQVEVYGARMAIKGVASINVTDAKSLAVEPWDKTLMKAVEDAIRNSGLGLNPVNDGKAVRINMPALTEESRRNLLKIVGQKAEEARIRLRKSRDEIRSAVIVAEEKGEMPEDERFMVLDKLDVLIKDFNEKIKEVVTEKENDIMTI